MLKNKLQIYLITYNRKKKLQETLETILAEKSPIKDFDITILDNASTDDSSELIKDYCLKYQNIKHIRHEVNIGGNANICRAFEHSATCGKDYAWILCDDDKFDFSNWSEVENHIKNDIDLICVSDYAFPTQKEKESKAYQIFQMTFVPASIFKTKYITNTVLMNMYDAILTMFQQTCLTAHIINNNGTVEVLKRPIVHNGLHFKDKVDTESLSFTRGTEDKKEILERRKQTFWILGFVNIVTLLKDKNLQKECVEISIPYKDIYRTWKNFYNHMYFEYFNKNNFNYFIEVYKMLKPKRKLAITFFIFKYTVRWIFALKNSPDKKYKYLVILGYKFKIPRKKA